MADGNILDTAGQMQCLLHMLTYVCVLPPDENETHRGLTQIGRSLGLACLLELANPWSKSASWTPRAWAYDTFLISATNCCL